MCLRKVFSLKQSCFFFLVFFKELNCFTYMSIKVLFCSPNLSSCHQSYAIIIGTMTAIFLVKDIQWPTTTCNNIEVLSLALRCSVMCISELFLFNYYPLLFFFFFFWPVHATCGILVSWPGMESMTPTLGAWKLNHWTIKEVLIIHYFQFITCIIFIILLLLSTNISSEKTAKLVNEHMSSQSIGDWHMWTGMCDTMKWAQTYKKKWEH